MSAIISVCNVTRDYKVYASKDGWGFVRSLISHKYEIRRAVNDVCFQIGEGEIVGLVGPNGAGKTTIVKMLCGVLEPTLGTISIGSYTPWQKTHLFLHAIGVVTGNKGQLRWHLPVKDSLLLNKEIFGLSKEQYESNLSELSEILDFHGYLDTPVKQLSLGTRMKAEIICALLHKPKVLFLDEPTIGLDVVVQSQLRSFLREYQLKNNATIVLTSHYMRDVEALCGRILFLSGGKLVFDGPLSDVRNRFAANKKVILTTESELEDKFFDEFGHIVNRKNNVVTLLVSAEQVGRLINKVVSTTTILDTTIEEEPIEDVFIRLYQDAEI